MEDKFTEVQ